jgi:hypothetical protein
MANQLDSCSDSLLLISALCLCIDIIDITTLPLYRCHRHLLYLTNTNTLLSNLRHDSIDILLNSQEYLLDKIIMLFNHSNPRM